MVRAKESEEVLNVEGVPYWMCYCLHISESFSSLCGGKEEFL